MFGSEITEVALGVTLLFLMVSLICTAANEAIETLLQSRGRTLERGVSELLGPDALASLYNNPMVSGLFKGDYLPKAGEGPLAWLKVWKALPRWWSRRRLPSYIPAESFVAAVIDHTLKVAVRAQPLAPSQNVTAGDLAAKLRNAVEHENNPRLKAALQYALAAGGTDSDKIRKHLEDWYNGAMDRVSGWYKRQTQLSLFLLGLAAAVLLNLDVITITQRLSEDRALRSAVVAAAGTLVAQEAEAKAGADDEDLQPAAYEEKAAANETAETSARLGVLKSELQAIGYPMGWRGFLPAPQASALCGGAPSCSYSQLNRLVALQVILGWLMLALATTLGSSFWFDMLNKVMVIRSTVKPTEKSPNEKSEDRQ